MSSTFYPTAIYMSDLTRCMSGLSQIFPTKFVACTIKAPGKDKPIPGFDAIETKTEGEPVVNYTETRRSLWKSLKDLNPTDSCYGDINFIGTSLEGGKNLSEVYIQIDKDTWNRPYIFQEEPADPTSLENLKDKRTTTDGTNYTEPVANMAPVERASKESYTYNAIILYYNLYLVDPSGQSSGVKPVCTELPMGIYYLGQKKEIKERSVTRLNMLIGTDKNAVPVNTGQASSSTYAALTQSLLAFSQGFEVIRKEVESPEIGKYIGGEIKQELDHFRDNCAVNVPYIKDGYWFVNGRKYGKAYGLTSTDDEKVKKIVQDKAQEYIKGNPDEFRGEPGKDGKPGKDGAGMNIKDVLNSVSDRPAIGENPGDAYIIGTDLHVWPSNGSSKNDWVIIRDFKGAKGEKGDPGKDGNPGKDGSGITFKGVANSTEGITDKKAGDCYIVGDNILIWDGKAWVDGDALRGPAGKKGDEGVPGKDGKDCTVAPSRFVIPDCDEIDICLVYRCLPNSKYEASSIYNFSDNRDVVYLPAGDWYKHYARVVNSSNLVLEAGGVSPMHGGGNGGIRTNKFGKDDDNLQHYDEKHTDLDWLDGEGNPRYPNPGGDFDIPPIGGAQEHRPSDEENFYKETPFLDYDFTTRLDNIHNIRKNGNTVWPNKYKFTKKWIDKDGNEKEFNHDNLSLPMWGFCGNAEFYAAVEKFGIYKSNKKKEGNVLDRRRREEMIEDANKAGAGLDVKDSANLYKFIPLVKAGKIPNKKLEDFANFLQVRCLTIRPKNFIEFPAIGSQVINSMLSNGDCALRFSSFFHVCAGMNANWRIKNAPDVDLYICGYRGTGPGRTRIEGSEHIFPIDGEMRPLTTHEGLEWTHTASRRALFNMAYDPVSRATIIAPAGFSCGREKNIAEPKDINAEIEWMMNPENIKPNDNQ